MNARLTIPDMQVFAADLHARCTPREGYVSERVALYLSRDDIEALNAIAVFLALISPFRIEIARLVDGSRQ